MRALLCAAAFVLAAAPARAELRVSMHDGRVSIDAADVTVRQILAEWARVGQATIVNAEGIPGGPVTLQLTDVPEEQALDILLRSAAGYLAAPRGTAISDAARFDRIIVMPTSSPSRTSAPPPAPQPRFQPFEPDDQDPARNAPPPAPPLSQQIQQQQLRREAATYPPTTLPQEPSATQSTPFATPMPGAPTGVATPGMVVPAPQPGQPIQPVQGGEPQAR